MTLNAVICEAPVVCQALQAWKLRMVPSTEQVLISMRYYCYDVAFFEGLNYTYRELAKT